MLIDPPSRLPVSHLSVSAINRYLKSPIAWRKRYIEGETELASPSQVLGRAAGAAERDSYGHQIETGQPYTERELLDGFNDAWSLELERSEIDWEDERPGRVKDSGYRVLPVYHRLIAPTVKPIAIERGFSIEIPGVEWTITGYLDVEETSKVDDLKIRSRSRGIVSPEEAAVDLQPTFYLAARRAEGNAAERFDFHTMVRARRGQPVRLADVAVTPAYRTGDELDAAIELACRVAAEIDWRMQYDVWTPPPRGSWWCSRGWCGYWASCEFGGKLRPQLTPAMTRPRLPRRIPDAEVYAAIDATALKRTGETTAAKVAAHLGISTATAAARLRTLPDVASERPTKSSGRGKEKVTVIVPGPRVYKRIPPAERLAEAA